MELHAERTQHTIHRTVYIKVAHSSMFTVYATNYWVQRSVEISTTLIMYDETSHLEGATCRSDTTCKSRLGLLNRAAPEEGLQWFEVDPFVCLHTGAAWEEGSLVHLVTCRRASSLTLPNFTGFSENLCLGMWPQTLTLSFVV